MKDINPVQAQMNIAVVALVALVAIIGLVALVLNAPVLGKEVVPSVEQAAQISTHDISSTDNISENLVGNMRKRPGRTR